MESAMKLRTFTVSIIVLLCGLVTACQAKLPTEGPRKPVALKDIPDGMEVALFAGGCFWCMEGPFDKIGGVRETLSGYTDGFVDKPKYRDVARGLTGHTEAIRVVFDPKIVSYKQLVDVFWRNIDPFAQNRQFCDRGTQYRSGIYPYNSQQMKIAQESRDQLKLSHESKGKIHTEIKSATRFYIAEEYHQDYYLKNPRHYMRYRLGCGRDARLKEIWGTPESK
jgi:peptide-methionine (S)-S-oxide reductase